MCYALQTLIREFVCWLWKKRKYNSNRDNYNNERSSIQFKKCPKCKTPISHTTSLNTYIQASLRDIQEVKKKIHGSEKQKGDSQLDLHNRVSAIMENNSVNGHDPLHLNSIFKDIMEKTKIQHFGGDIFVPRPKSRVLVVALSNQFEMARVLRDICSGFQTKLQLQTNLSAKTTAVLKSRFAMAASFIRVYQNCGQQRADIANEISLLQLMGDAFAKTCGQTFNDIAKQMLENAFVSANEQGRATESVRNEFKAAVNAALVEASGIGISLEEKEMVLKAMGFAPGHWYKCPNGHVYAIGDCGGAMQESKCPECGSAIGGVSHRLVSGNAVATDMDGATAPAWPQ